MSVVEPGAATSGLIERVKAILLRPSPTWETIAAEPASIGGIYKSYVIPLALIPAVAGLIGALVFGYGAFGIGFKPSIVGALISAVVSFGATLLGVYLMSLIINALAPTFGGEKNPLAAFKVAAYSATAGWVAGIFQIFPPLMVLGLLGLYSFYLLHRGLPRLMKAPEEKATTYTAAVVVVAVVLGIVLGALISPLARIGASAGLAAGAVGGGKVVIGDKSIDMGKLEQQSKRIEQAAKQMQSGEGVEVIKPEVLKAYLPDSAAGFTRTEVTTGSGGAAGVSGSQAEGVYSKGEASIKLSVTDLGAAGALAGLASAFNMESSTEKDGKYEKMGKVDGRMTQESYDRSSKHGQYTVLVGERILVAAEGDGVSMDELKNLVKSVDPAKLEALAKG